MIQVCHRILSFREVAAWAEKGVSVRLLLRHSMRRSLTEGTLDPGLTPEGTEYALACGKLLAGLKDLTVGSSPRLRCHETAQCLIRGGDLPVVEPVRNCAEIGDDAMFLSRETLEELLCSDHVKETLETYYATGSAPGMKPLCCFAEDLTSFLTETDFGKKNVLFLTHDILCVALLLYWKVYPFRQDDWMGYIQGVCFWQESEKVWNIAYVVPDASERAKSILFV